MAKGHENLIPTNKRSKEEARELGKKGGQASGVARRKKIMMKDLAMELLNSNIQDDELKARILNIFPDVDPEKMQIQTAMTVAQINKALKGDSKAFEVIRDTSGQKPIEQQIIAFDESNELIIDLGEYPDGEPNDEEND